MQILCLAEDLHKKSRLIFSENNENVFIAPAVVAFVKYSVHEYLVSSLQRDQ